MKVFAYFSILFLAACTTSDNKDGGFYTWVDAYGQVHTEKREDSKQEEALLSEDSVIVNRGLEGNVVSDQIKKQPSQDTNQSFNPAEFTSSEIIDDQLTPKRLYNWQDQGASISREVGAEGDPEDQPVSFIEIEKASAGSNYEHLASSEITLWDDVKGLELKLSRSYSYSDKLKQDYLLIELPSVFEAGAVIFKSYIKSNRLALPNLVFLNERFDMLSGMSLPFSHHVSETWSSHGFMQGVIKPPVEAQYILMLSNPNPGVLELGDKKVRLIDLGSIMIDAY